MTHAMTVTAVSAKDDQEGTFIRWRVENSWSEDRGHKGYLCRRMSGSLSACEVVVGKKHVPEEVPAALEQEPAALPAWGRVGALAK